MTYFEVLAMSLGQH